MNGQFACGIGRIEAGLELSDLGIARSKLVLGGSRGVGLCQLDRVRLTSSLRTQAIHLALQLGSRLLRIGTGLGGSLIPSSLLRFRGGGKLGLKLGHACLGLAPRFLNESIRLSAQVCHLGVMRGHDFLQPLVRLGARKGQGAFGLAPSRSLTLGNIVHKLRGTHLANDIGIARLVNLKHLAAMRALNLVHGAPLADLLSQTAYRPKKTRACLMAQMATATLLHVTATSGG